MKRLFWSVAALVIIFVGVIHAQDLAGTWQGTLDAGRPLRIVIKITNDGGLKAVLYSIDQGAQATAASSVSLQGSTVKIGVPGIGANYEGKLSADANTIDGTFTQGMPRTLNLSRATPDTAWAIPEPPAALKPMASGARPTFELATIKPSNPDTPGKLLTVRGRQVVTVNMTLVDLITFSYSVQAKQIVGGPDWLETAKYDVTGQPDIEGVPSVPQLRLMLQKLLADRFTLTFHHGSRELNVYALVVGAKAPTLTTSAANPNGLPGLFFRGLGNLVVSNATMSEFTDLMQGQVLDRPVVDRTGLTGHYDFTLRWTPDETQFGGRVPPPKDDPTAPPVLFTAIQEQLGLKFEATKAPVDVLVIDKVDRPSEN